MIQHMIRFLTGILVIAFAHSLAMCEQLSQNIDSVTAYVEISETVEVTKKMEPIFRSVICNFAITPSDSLPSSVILSGKVVSNNSGAPTEFVPVFFGSQAHFPRLAALTNVDGEFRFRVWLPDKPEGQHGLRLRAANIKNSKLYLGGKFDGNGEMLSSYTHVHALKDFQE